MSNVRSNAAGSADSFGSYLGMSGQVTQGRTETPMRTNAGRTLTMARPDPLTREAKCLDSGRKDGNAIWRADKDPYDGDYRTQRNGDLIAKMLCEGCPIIAECLSMALEQEGDVNGRNRYGVRGGMTPEGRARLVGRNAVCPNGHDPERMTMRQDAGHQPYWRCRECDAEAKRDKRGSAA